MKQISVKTYSRIDLYRKAYRRSTVHILTTRLKQIKLNRNKRLLKWHAVNGHESIIFTKEQNFTVEKVFNTPNNKIYANFFKDAKSAIPRVPRGLVTIQVL